MKYLHIFLYFLSHFPEKVNQKIFVFGKKVFFESPEKRINNIFDYLQYSGKKFLFIFEL
jgi:hypothetical protein